MTPSQTKVNEITDPQGGHAPKIRVAGLSELIIFATEMHQTRGFNPIQDADSPGNPGGSQQ
jgi:hypothetical protein